MKYNTRDITVLALMETLEKGNYSHIVLKNVLDKYGFLDARDRHFIARLFRGTIERLITLDYLINLYSKTKVKKMKPFVRTLLRMSAYQIVFMDSVPDSAAVNEAVKLMKMHGFSSLSGFANGVLRSIVKGKPYSFNTPDIRYSVPQWILDKWDSEYNKNIEYNVDSLDSLNTERPLCVRMNTARFTVDEIVAALESEGVTIVRPNESNTALLLMNYDRPDQLDSFKNGMYYIQDLTSQIMIELAEIQPGDNVIDVCAAPGGKAIAAATFAGATGHVEARDLTDSKCDIIRENVARMALQNISVKKQDATELDDAAVDSADVLICDLPCSGLGIIGRKPDIRYRIQPEDIVSLAQLQQDILSTVCGYVKKGGKLIYSTCTISKDENQNQVQQFVAEHPEFNIIKEQQFFITDTHDGFYVCVLSKV